MNINVKNAISRFYPSPRFQQIYYEAVANAFDAGADRVNIVIKIDEFSRVDTLEIAITDNGEGFTDRNFDKFSNLMEIDGNDHKGLGRLVYLAYFEKVKIVSLYGKNKRTFDFHAKFRGASKKTTTEIERSETVLVFQRFSNERIKSYDNLRPSDIKKDLLEQFLPMLFRRIQDGKDFRISIELQTNKPNPEYDFYSTAVSLTPADIPDFKKEEILDLPLDMFESMEIYYNIAHDPSIQKSIVTSISVDQRLIPYSLMPIEAVPAWFQLKFLFMSEYFQGKSDASREFLAIPNATDEKILKQFLRKEVSRIISREIPVVEQSNQKTKQELDRQFPHLLGYFPTDTVGLIVRNEVIATAQEKFFADQKATLECVELDDAAYSKALEMSARVLLEYILYRTKIIEKLKSINFVNSEGEIHDLVVPRRRVFNNVDFSNDIFNNNVWMLDDKYMSYTTVLSDADMGKVIREIAVAEDPSPSKGRPDIALVFSADPETSPKVDVVLVELKKRGLDIAKKEQVVSQLKQRARRLLGHYREKIGRIWFYGIADIDDEFRRSLKEDGFIQLFSHGEIYYKQQPIIPDGTEEYHFVDLFVMTCESFIKDAEQRNLAFLSMLKKGIRDIIHEQIVTVP
ncbi:MAG: sensor histidine kinase [Candidatus Hydrogenedentes bacterium]|nr:sensor histidine kinase [Candidatus Hydrogenedentota bacterium]